MRSTTVAMALLSSVVAADSVTTIFLPFFDQQPLVASIVGSDATATTYAIACAPGTDSTECGIPTGFTMTEGPKTMALQMVDGDRSIASEAVCVETVGGAEANFPGTSTTTLEPSDYASAWIAVTVTAGAATGAAATTAASATAPTASATTKAAATTAAHTGSAASTTSGLSTVASSSSTGTASAKASASVVSTGGMPQITGNAQWAMGGVAVAMALAAL
uniref:Low-density lipoprotein receptor-related protein 8 n=1 Tax=Talaromyces marneffei PM1 TaxID=1077442 RepID=A0A093V066_TALMA